MDTQTITGIESILQWIAETEETIMGFSIEAWKESGGKFGDRIHADIEWYEDSIHVTLCDNYDNEWLFCFSLTTEDLIVDRLGKRIRKIIADKLLEDHLKAKRKEAAKKAAQERKDREDYERLKERFEKED